MISGTTAGSVVEAGGVANETPGTLVARLKFAALRQAAVIDIDLRTPRGIDRAFFAKLVDGDWIARKQNLSSPAHWRRQELDRMRTGPQGMPRQSFCPLPSHAAAVRSPRAGTRRWTPCTPAQALSRVELLILDDWGLAPLTADQRRDLLEIVDDRHQRGSTIITSQVPVDHWHEVIADPTIADAVLDRLVHNAHRLVLSGDSMRKITAQTTNLDAAKKP